MPQGGVLDPQLPIIYINGVFNATNHAFYYLRATHTSGTAYGTVYGKAILETFCDCSVALDTRKWKRFSEAQGDMLSRLSNLRLTHIESENRFTVRRSIRHSIRRTGRRSTRRSTCVACPLRLQCE